MADYLRSSAHNHTNLCDGKNSLQEMVSAACRQGLTVLGFTGHSHTPCDLEYCMSPGRTSRYKAEIAKLKNEYRGKLDVLCGLEYDLYSDDKLNGYDYWIGSVHYICGPKTGRYYEMDWRKQDLRDCIDTEFDGDALAMVESYFNNVCEICKKNPPILAHFDLVKKLNGAGEFFDEEDPRYRAAAEKALQAAKESGAVLEVNTSGIYRGFRKDYYPADWVLEQWLAMGGKVIITADAHDVASLTFGFADAGEHLKRLGYQKVQVLTVNGFEDCPL